jgi:hypothetical protein
MKTEINITNRQLLARALWLAFQASSPMGLGILHAARAAEITEEQLAEACIGDPNKSGTIEVRTDYVSGRMMKTSFKVTADGTLTIWPETPRGDYQSWSGTYQTATELVAATHASFVP